jgi:hypothetical protein
MVQRQGEHDRPHRTLSTVVLALGANLLIAAAMAAGATRSSR